MVFIVALAVLIVKGKLHCVRSGPALATGVGIKVNTNDLDCSTVQGVSGLTYIVNVTEPFALSIFEGI